MNVKRTITLGVLGGALAVWLAAASTSNVPPPATIVTPKSNALDVSAAALAADITRLHDRLRPTVEPAQSRDLFRYAARPAGRRAPEPVPPPAAEESPVASPAPLPLKLVGIAEDAGDAGAVRTAILSGSGELFFVKEGETVTPRYRVANIAQEAVELLDLTDNSTLRLPLK